MWLSYLPNASYAPECFSMSCTTESEYTLGQYIPLPPKELLSKVGTSIPGKGMRLYQMYHSSPYMTCPLIGRIQYFIYSVLYTSPPLRPPQGSYHNVFGYTEDIYHAHERFWTWTLRPCLDKVSAQGSVRGSTRASLSPPLTQNNKWTKQGCNAQTQGSV